MSIIAYHVKQDLDFKFSPVKISDLQPVFFFFCQVSPLFNVLISPFLGGGGGSDVLYEIVWNKPN